MNRRDALTAEEQEKLNAEETAGLAIPAAVIMPEANGNAAI